MQRYKFSDLEVPPEELIQRIAPAAHKFQWFAEHGYAPHYYQILFHAMWNGEKLCRYRNLVAGRRGGKTLSAAWETIYYAMNPRAFHWDAHKVEKDRPLHIWVLTPDYRSAGRAALFTLREVLRDAGFKAGVEYNENRGEKWIEFANGSMLEFKTAERPEQLVGAGLDLMWIDEAAVVPNDDAWMVARPALSDKQGIVIGTTTPRGKNWYYDIFWGTNAETSDHYGSVEYRSIDNPYFAQEEWEEAARDYHPLFFKREFMAAFDAMSGIELSGDWLHYYQEDELPTQKDDPSRLDLDIYIGVDPAISASARADRFAAAVIGVNRNSNQVYLLELYAKSIPFPDQLTVLRDLFTKWRPIYAGIESNAYQAALAQQVARLEGLPNVVAVYAQGKKEERIMSMSPLFKNGKIKIRKDQFDFIDEWVGYDPRVKHPKDDTLDAVEIALRCTGALLPQMPQVATFEERPAANITELAKRELANLSSYPYDEHMGADF